MWPASKRRRSQVAHHRPGPGISHDKHGPHRGGHPSAMCERFPNGEYLDDGGNTNNLEVVGFTQFIHARCPHSSPEPCTCGRHSCHLDSLIVAVDGACPGNGSTDAVGSGCGVYFGPQSAQEPNFVQQNLSFRVPDHPDYPHTSQRAELHAAVAGLKTAQKFATHGGQWPCEDDCEKPCELQHLIIKSDSAYLVNGITQSATKWVRNGWLTAKKTPVKNQDLWEALLKEMAVLNALDVAVGFWLVPREKNQDADLLANLGVHSKFIFTDQGLRFMSN